MIPLQIDKKRLSHFVDCLQNGKAIQPSPETGFNSIDMITLAGACFLGGIGMQEQLYGDISHKVSEQREMIADTHVKELHAAIQFIAAMASLIVDDAWDEHFKPKVVLGTALVDGEAQVDVLKGRRKAA